MTYYVLSQLFYSIIYVLFKSTFVVALYFFLKHLIRAFDIVASSFQYLSYKLITKQIVKYDHQRKWRNIFNARDWFVTSKYILTYCFVHPSNDLIFSKYNEARMTTIPSNVVNSDLSNVLKIRMIHLDPISIG